MSTRDTTAIRINLKTKAALDELRHPGQSYDGLLREMLVELVKARGPSLALAQDKRHL